MSKRELINAIIEYNRTAAPEFLARFGEQDLQAYLERVAIVMPIRKPQLPGQPRGEPQIVLV